MKTVTVAVLFVILPGSIKEDAVFRSRAFCAPLEQYIGRHIDRLSTDVSVDISVKYRSRVGRYVDRDVSVDI